MTMRIGLNATCFNERPSGARQRFLGIYGALIRQCQDDEFIVYEPRDCRVGLWFGGAPNVRIVATPLPSTGRLPRATIGHRYWRTALAQDRLDLFETFHLPLVLAPACPTIMTLHDPRSVICEGSRLRRWLSARVMRPALKRADQVITVSRTMCDELRGIEPEVKVTAVYNGIDAAPFAAVDAADAERVRTRFGLPEGFLLAVGHLERRKNYGRLIEALARLRDAGQEHFLVIVGLEGGYGSAVRAAVARLGMDEHVRILSGVSDLELRALYSLSRLVVFPSYYEGFGIPILEAMAARRPLVTSDIKVFRELTEDNGAYFPPHDAAAMAATLEEVLGDAARRAALVAYGDRRVLDFNFDRLAGQVAAVHRTVLGRDSESRPAQALG